MTAGKPEVGYAYADYCALPDETRYELTDWEVVHGSRSEFPASERRHGHRVSATDRGCPGLPDPVVEILSASTREQGWGAKRGVFARV